METEIKTLICKDCRYFMRHYVAKRTGVNPISCGHCVHEKNRAPFKKPSRAVCQYFESIDSEKKSRNNKFRDAVSDISKKLEELLLIIPATDD